MRMAVIYRLERKKILASQFEILNMVQRVLLLDSVSYSQISCLEKTEEEENEDDDMSWF